MYAGYFGALGVLLPFLPVHLGKLGFTGAQIGMAMAFSPIMVIFAPIVWGYLADRTQRGLLLLRIAIAGSAGALFFVATGQTFWPVTVAMLVYAAFNAPVVPLADAATLAAIQDGRGDYARVRLFGSLGFVAGAFGVGLWTSGAEAAGAPVIMVAGASLALAGVASLGLRRPGQMTRPPSIAEVRALLSDRPLRLLLFSSGLHFIAMCPYHAFFAVHVRALDLPGYVTGGGFALGGLAEVGALAVFGRLASRWSKGRLLAIGFGASAVRWLLTGVATSGPALIAIQALHGLSFGLFYAGAIGVLSARVPEHLRATGQGLFFAVVFGMFGGVGIMVSGFAYDAVGGHTLFAAAAVVSVLATLSVWRIRDD